MGVLHNAKNIFVSHKNPFASMEKRFVKNEQTGKKREKAIIEMYDNPSFVNLLKFLNAKGFKKLPLLENNITGLLDRFTDDTISDEELKQVQQNVLLRNADDITNIDYLDRNKITITLQDRTIEAERLSHKFPLIAEHHPDMLSITTRKGKCHLMSIMLAIGLENNDVVATGTIHRTTPRAKFLHSWVEENVDGIDWCYDFTYNLALKQEDYYYLFHAEPYEKISAKQIKRDAYSIAKLIENNPLYSKLYLSSRKEALKIADHLPDSDFSIFNIGVKDDYEMK